MDFHRRPRAVPDLPAPLVIVMAVWTNRTVIAQLNGYFHVRQNALERWPRPVLRESMTTIAVERRILRGIGNVVLLRGNDRTTGVDPLSVVMTITTVGVAPESASTATRRQSSGERELETVRSNAIRHRRRQFAKVETTAMIVPAVTIGSVEVVALGTSMAAVTTIRMIHHRGVITSSETGAIGNRRGDTRHRHRPGRLIDEVGKSTVLGTGSIILRRSTVTDRTIRNRTRDLRATGKKSAGRKPTVGSGTKIVRTGSTRSNASGNTMTIRRLALDRVIRTLTGDEAVAAAGGKDKATRIRTKVVPATGTENPRKTWNLARVTSLLDVLANRLENAAACSDGTRTRVRPCTISTSAKWAATWNGAAWEDAAVAASDHPIVTASTVLSRTWQINKCSSTSTNIIRPKWDRTRVALQ